MHEYRPWERKLKELAWGSRFHLSFEHFNIIFGVAVKKNRPWKIVVDLLNQEMFIVTTLTSLPTLSAKDTSTGFFPLIAGRTFLS